MRCPFCDHPDTQVIETRESDDGESTRRRRRCLNCDKRFTTYERVEDTLPLVVKKDGRRESFDREKISGGLKKAVEKRPVPAEQLEQMLDAIEQKVQEAGEKEVQSRFIGELVMKALQQIDDVAYVRFASVYRDFRDVQEFMNELKELLAERSKLDRAARKRVSRAS